LPHVSASDIVWQVSHGAGMTTSELALSAQPSVTVYGDGRYLVPHQDVGGDGTAFVSLDEGRLNPTTLSQLRQRIATSQVFDQGELDLGTPQVSDAGTTSIRGLDAEGHVVELDAYGLGTTTGLTARQADLRSRIDRLLRDLGSWVPDSAPTPYRPSRLEVFAHDPTGTSDSPGPDMQWPGPPPKALFGSDRSCSIVSGQSVTRLLGAARHNPTWRWRTGDDVFAALVRIAIPGSEVCDD
jgi:hypothetical protein